MESLIAEVDCALPSFFSLELADVLGPLAILFSALIALMAINANKKLARRRATLDIIEKSESNAHYLKTIAAFQRCLKAGLFKENSQIFEDEYAEDLRLVQQYLNHYELIAIGIKNKIIDEKLYKYWLRTVFVNDWVCVQKTVQARRYGKGKKNTSSTNYDDKIFCEYNQLAKKWAMRNENVVVLKEDCTFPMDDDD